MTIMTVVQTVLLVAAAFVTASWVGTAFGKFWDATLRLAAASLFSTAVGQAAWEAASIPLVGTVVWYVLLVVLLELEFYEAFIFTCVFFAVSVIVGVTAMILLNG